MRIALAAASAAVMFAAAPAAALPYADIGTFATYTFGVTINVTPAGGPEPVTVTISSSGSNINGEQELEGVNGFVTDVSGLSLTSGLGGANNGQSFTTDYDRSQVTDPAEMNGTGIETGTIVFTIGATTLSSFDFTGGTGSVQMGGEANADDGGTFYGLEPGSWSFGGSFSTTTGDGLGSFTVSIPPDPDVVSEPAVLALAGFGLLGLALARRRV